MPAPVAPITVTPDSRLTDDVLLVQKLSIDPDAIAGTSLAGLPDGTLHRFAILVDQGAVQLQASTASASGYRVTPLPGGSGATEIISVVDRSGVLHVLYATSAAVLHTSSSDGIAWNEPDVLQAATALAAARIPLGGSTTVYGVGTDGNLILFGGGATSWTATTVNVGSALVGASVRLEYTAPGPANTPWVLAAAAGGPVQVWTGYGSTVESGPMSVAVANPASRILFSYSHAGSAMFVFTDTQNHLYTTVGFTDTPAAIPLSSITQGAGVVGADGLIRFYGADPNGTLWVLRQTGWDDREAPIWAPIFPLDLDVTFVAEPLAGGGGTTLSVMRADGTLDLLTQASADGRWSRIAVHADATVPVHTSRYRTQLTLVDANGTPCAGSKVSVVPSTLVALEVDGATIFAAPAVPAVLTADARGSVTFSQPATGLDAVTFTVTGSGVPSPVPVRPYEYLHANLAGAAPIFTGSLTLPPLTPAGLQTAMVRGAPLAPGLTSDMASVVTSGVQQALALSSGKETDVCGYEVNLRDARNPSFDVFHQRADVEARFAILRQSAGASAWGDIGQFASDVWRGIESGAMNIVSWVVDTASKVVSVVVQFANSIEATLHNLTMDAVADVGKVVAFVQNVFARIGAAIERILDWLKDFFEWRDMWNTMVALNGYLTDGLTSVSNWLGKTAVIATGEFFQDLKGKVDEGFASALTAVGGQTISRSGGPPPSGQLPGSPGQNDWMYSKASAYLPASSYAALPSGLPETIVSQLKAAIDSSCIVTDSRTEYAALQKFFTDLAADPPHLGHVLLIDVMRAAHVMIDIVLDGVDLIATVLLDLASDLIQAAVTALTTPLPDIPVLSWLWNEIRPAGNDEPLTLGALVCLVFAVPLTLFYKLTHDNNAPFTAASRASGPVLASAARRSPVRARLAGDVLDDVNFGFSFLLAAADIANDTVTATSNFDDSATTRYTLFINWMDGVANVIAQYMSMIAATNELPDKPTFGQTLSMYALVGYWAPITMDVAFTTAETGYFVDATASPALLGTVQMLLDCILGGLLMGLGIAGTAYELRDKPPNATATDMFEAICGPMPWATQFLLCKSCLEATDPPGTTAGLQVAIDVYGDLDWSDFPGAAPQPAFAG